MKKSMTLWAACALPMLSPLAAQEGADEQAQIRKDRERLIDLVINLEADFSTTLRDYGNLQKDYASLLKKPASPDRSGEVKELQEKLKEALAKLDLKSPSKEDARTRALLEQDLVNLRNELHRERQDLLVARARLLRVKELEEKNKTLEKNLGESEADRTKTTAEAKTLMTRLKESMDNLAKSEKSHRETIARLGQLEEEATALNQKVKNQDGELTTLRAEQDQSKRAMAAAVDLKKEQERLTTLLGEREKQLANLQSHLAAEVERTLEIPILVKARDELEKKLKESTATTEDLKQQNEALAASKGLLENEIENLKKNIGAMRTQLEKNEETMATVAKITRDNEVLKSERGTLEETIKMAKEELVKAMGVRNRLEAELETGKKEAAEAIARKDALEDTNQGLIAEQALLREHLQETKETVAQNAREQGELRNTVTNLEKEKTTLTGEISTRNTELAKLRTALAKKPDHSADIEKLQKEKDELAAELARREEDLKKTRNELGRLQISSTASKNQLVALKRETATIAPVRYAKGEADVTAQQARVLTQVENVLKLFPSARFEIVGHTCDIGTAEANLELSRKRAQSLHDFLLSKGIEADRLKFRGVGQSEPMVPNTNETNRRQNRRVVVEILD